MKFITFTLSLTLYITSTFSLKSQDIEVLNFDEFEKYITQQEDKLYVVNFWASWCAPCVKELPYFIKIKKEYQEIELIFVSLDFGEKQLKKFLLKNNIIGKHILLDDTDQNSWIPKVAKKWSGSIPATLIYNKNKRMFYERSFNYSELKKEIDKFK